jgi:endothelin-converting enzyme/putative endopeptidase
MRNSLAFLLSALLPLVMASAQNSPRKQPPVVDVTSMDMSVDPCVDFYTYSCGGWMKKNPIPPDQTNWSAYNKLQDDTLATLREILETAAAPNPGRDPIKQKIGDYYASCMDETAIDSAGIKPLQSDLDRINQLRSKADLADLFSGTPSLYRNEALYRSTLFRVGSQQDAKDSTQVIAAVDQGGLGLPDRDYYLKDDPKSVELRQAYLAHVQKMFTLLGDKPEIAATEAQAVMRIETALAKGSLTRVERRDPQKLYHKMTGEELASLGPAFHWDRYFVTVGLPSLKSLNVATPDFFKAENEEIEKEDLASWKAYLRWHLVYINAPYMSAPFRNADFDFYQKTLRGAEQIEPRWKRCVNNVDNDLGEALGQAYVERAFPPEAKQRALKMVKQIEDAMQRDIQSLPWMSETTKQRAVDKLHAVANKIGYPDHWRDYSALQIARNDALGNVLHARVFEFNRELAKIGKPVDHGEWDMTPPTVNAEYNPQRNDINFPAGILQPPLFDPASDDAPNYGNTGGTIGHELTHGFDDEGRQFDGQGNLRDWWTADDAKEFEKRTSCIANQYSAYTIVDDIKINGKLTLGEDVADLGGLILAYMAWQDETRGQKLDSIEGLTPEQRFFIGYGQSWCANERDETKRLRATVDPHSPEKYRANGVVSNMPEFQQAFHCKPGAAMVRENACRVW